jgi:hypothetical protein
LAPPVLAPRKLPGRPVWARDLVQRRRRPILAQGHKQHGPRRSKRRQAALAHMSRLLAALATSWARRAGCRRRRAQVVRRQHSRRRRTKRRQFRAHGELRLKRRKPFSRPGPSARGRRNRALQA